MNFAVKDCPSFHLKGNEHSHSFHSHEAMDTTEIHLAFLTAVLEWFYYSRFSDFLTILPSSKSRTREMDT